MTTVAAQDALVTVRKLGTAVVLEVADALDTMTGRVLIDAVTSAIATAPDRVDIDVRALVSWTDEGARSLVRCRELCRDLPDGLHYRTGRGPGREALLAAYA
ncbi:MAG: hypothetical protein WD691_10790 [Acidimicrobiales bacterium]